uniref:Uncharacterized protein n=1 Tax=Anguilla anguilla TaxID=7936 RepID=A0A0E9W7H4_ANGAN
MVVIHFIRVCITFQLRLRRKLLSQLKL